jgi:hypothetical protein
LFGGIAFSDKLLDDMATLTVLIWMLVIVLFFHGFSYYAAKAIENNEMFVFMPKTIITSWIFIHLATIMPISIAIYWDLYGSPPTIDFDNNPGEALNFYLLCGLVALGITAISSMWMNYRIANSSSELSQNSRQVMLISPRLIVDTIAVIGAIVGIISFYLDYLR